MKRYFNCLVALLIALMLAPSAFAQDGMQDVAPASREGIKINVKGGLVIALLLLYANPFVGSQ